LFVFLVEKAFCGKLFLEFFELPAQFTFAGRFELLDDHLIVAARFVEADLAKDQRLVAVFEIDRWATLALAEECTAHLRSVVLEAEIDMAGCWPGQVGYLAFNPDTRNAVFQQ